MSDSKLDKTLVAEPRLWRLYMLVADDAIDVMMLNMADDNGVITRQIPLPQSIVDPLRRIEEAVYDNPLLLSDFNRVTILVDTDRFAVVPQSLADTDTARQLLDSQYAFVDSFEPLIDEIPDQGVAIVAGVNQSHMGFLRRTFNNPRVVHRLAPLCRYFHDKSRIGNPGKMYAHIRGQRLDLLVFGRESLRLACSYNIRENIDAVYYIMALREQLRLDSQDDELLIAGDTDARDAVTPILREYLAGVMPAIFPTAMLRIRDHADTTPFELIVTPICE